MALVFDDDPYSLAKTFEANPFVMELTFPTTRTLRGFSIIIGSANAEINLRCYATPDAQPVIYSFQGQGSIDAPELSFDLPQPMDVQILRLEVSDVSRPDEAMIHIWELKLRP